MVSVPPFFGMVASDTFSFPQQNSRIPTLPFNWIYQLHLYPGLDRSTSNSGFPGKDLLPCAMQPFSVPIFFPFSPAQESFPSQFFAPGDVELRVLSFSLKLGFGFPFPLFRSRCFWSSFPVPPRLPFDEPAGCIGNSLAFLYSSSFADPRCFVFFPFSFALLPPGMTQAIFYSVLLPGAEAALVALLGAFSF